MYLHKVFLSNIRALKLVEWTIPAGSEPGWHVILGDNGAGKTTFLRAAVLGILSGEASYLQGPAEQWVGPAASEGHIVALSSAGQRAEKGLFANGGSSNASIEGRGHALPIFSAAYGPFRRFTGGDREQEKRVEKEPMVARHASLFSESIALTAALAWLQNLKFKQLEGSPGGDLLALILDFVNQPGFLPHGARIVDVTSSDVDVVDAHGTKLPIEALSDGYRSVLSMTLDLIRHMAVRYGNGKLFSPDHTQIIQPGVVLIDEIDAHLHPSWQHDIGIWFRKLFPRVQFIVSTHSPIICQAAEVGSVFRLPRPGVEDDLGEMLAGTELQRLVYGNVLDAYGTGVFGDDVTRSESGKEKLQQLAELNIKELTSALTEAEQRAQEELRSILPTEASITSEP